MSETETNSTVASIAAPLAGYDDNMASVVAKLVKDNLHADIVEIAHPMDGVKVPVMVMSSEQGVKMVPFDASAFDDYRDHPQRRVGTARVTDLDSFIAHVNRFKTAESAIFANSDKDHPGLRAVLDYHDRVNVASTDADGVVSTSVNSSALPRFGGHQTSYAFPLSKEWKAWLAKDGQPFDQGQFAAFIEDRILDVLAPPTFEGELTDADKDLKRLVDLLNGTFAGPESLMKLSRGLAVYESAKVINATNLNSGEGTITFETEHLDEDGHKLVVPNLFTIGIPVFEKGDAYRVVVRLRYRKQSGSIVWFYDLYRHDTVFEDAFKGACNRAVEGTGLPLFVGFPE